MKTRQQIEDYINSREWGKQFWMNSNITSEPWRLSWNKDMILLAFSWSDTGRGPIIGKPLIGSTPSGILYDVIPDTIG